MDEDTTLPVTSLVSICTIPVEEKSKLDDANMCILSGYKCTLFLIFFFFNYSSFDMEALYIW